MIRALIISTALVAVTPALAQSLPDWQHTSVNDFARVLTQEDTRALDEALIALHDQTGVEGTVVTLEDRASYGGGTLEDFATSLFNKWGVGDKDRNDGFMVLFLRDDREVRIELGRGYSRSADIRAQDVINRVMIPEFRDGDYSSGLRDGTQAVIDTIARPVAAGQPVAAPSRRNGEGWNWLPFGLFAGGAAAMIGHSRWRERRRNRCPKCGHQGVNTTVSPIRDAQSDGGWMTSNQTVTQVCPNCGWTDTRTAPMNTVTRWNSYGQPTQSWRRDDRPRSGGRSGGFGGGSSSGGGASGRW